MDLLTRGLDSPIIPRCTVVNVCVPTLKRYDLLANLLRSLNAGYLRPTAVYIINNGLDKDALFTAVKETIDCPVKILTPKKNLGVSASWNWFIRNVAEDRVIVNDDVTFAPESLEMIAKTQGDFVSALRHTNACSCFKISDICVRKVGYFDEKISPGYAYFEDCDYGERLKLKNVPITSVECGVMHGDEHGGSKTKAAYTREEHEDHHRRFQIAKDNFQLKWGFLPHGMGA